MKYIGIGFFVLGFLSLAQQGLTLYFREKVKRYRDPRFYSYGEAEPTAASARFAKIRLYQNDDE